MIFCSFAFGPGLRYDSESDIKPGIKKFDAIADDALSNKLHFIPGNHSRLSGIGSMFRGVDEETDDPRVWIMGPSMPLQRSGYRHNDHVLVYYTLDGRSSRMRN